MEHVVNIVVTAAVGKEMNVPIGIGSECLRRISQTSPRVKLTDGSAFLSEEQRGDFSHRAEFDAVLADAEVIFGFALPRDVLKRAPKLKWIQMMTAGVDTILSPAMVESQVMLTSVSGIHATPISEYVLGVMLTFAKGLNFCQQLKQEKKWKRYNPSTLNGKTVGVVGLGHIGREVARLSKAFGMNVIATRRSITEEAKARFVDELLPREKLPELLAKSDYVAITLPSTPETTRLIGEKELRLMKPTAYLINIGRGTIIDEEALVRALKEKWIAGAGLDVFSQEPLPAESPLWELPNVFQSPHISGGMEDYVLRATEVFCENIGRYVEGRKLLHLVDKRRGY